MTKDRKVAWVAMEKLVPLVLKVFPKHPGSRSLPGPPAPITARVMGWWSCLFCALYTRQGLSQCREPSELTASLGVGGG